MEKIPFFDLLTILLPGALLTLVIRLISEDFGFTFNYTEPNQYFLLTIFLSTSIFLGSFLNYLSELMIPFYKIIKLHIPLKYLYPNLKKSIIIKNFYDEIMKKIEETSGKGKNSEFKIEALWSQIFYYLEANEKINPSKSFQSFYFFFRNFFSLGLILFIPLLILIFTSGHNNTYLYLFGFNCISIVLSYLAGRWNRIKMVDRVFWNYFSLKNPDA